MLFDGVRNIFDKYGIDYKVNNVSSLGSVFFSHEDVTDYSLAKKSDTAKFADYFKYMLKNGVHMAPSQFEAIFVSDAHTGEHINTYLQLLEDYVK